MSHISKDFREFNLIISLTHCSLYDYFLFKRFRICYKPCDIFHAKYTNDIRF